MPIFHDPAFWTFLTAIIGCVRWLMKVAYAYKLRALRKQKSYTAELLITLDATVKEIRPIVEKHTKIIESFDLTAKAAANSEKLSLEHLISSQAMMLELKSQFTNLKTALTKSEQTSIGLLGEINSVRNELSFIKTEIIELKSGNIFVRTKK